MFRKLWAGWTRIDAFGRCILCTQKWKDQMCENHFWTFLHFLVWGNGVFFFWSRLWFSLNSSFIYPHTGHERSKDQSQPLIYTSMSPPLMCHHPLHWHSTTNWCATPKKHANLPPQLMCPQQWRATPTLCTPLHCSSMTANVDLGLCGRIDLSG